MSADDPRPVMASAYNNWRCRCDECRAAWAATLAALKVKRVARLAADPTAAPHGTASTYGNWGCRCEPCTKAHSAKSRERITRKAVAS